MTVDDLTPMQYLIMETVASRIRLGEHGWTFPKRKRFISYLKILERYSLITWRYDTKGNYLVTLTRRGRKMFLSSSYTPPQSGMYRECDANECVSRGIWEWEGVVDVRMTLVLNVHCTWMFCNEHDLSHRNFLYEIQGRPLQSREYEIN